MRGLKYVWEVYAISDCQESHPTRVRGLKFDLVTGNFTQLQSHPTRVRGLKYADCMDVMREYTVAPYTGAWIEIWMT